MGVKLIFFYDMRLNHRNPHNDQSLLNKRLELYIGSGAKKKKKRNSWTFLNSIFRLL